jgi:hypothetical protein
MYSKEGNDMTHTAKRIAKGHYTYRGYTVEDMRQWDSECKFWNVTAPNESQAHDSFCTLSQAKDWIDAWSDSM